MQDSQNTGKSVPSSKNSRSINAVRGYSGRRKRENPCTTSGTSVLNIKINSFVEPITDTEKAFLFSEDKSNIYRLARNQTWVMKFYKFLTTHENYSSLKEPEPTSKTPAWKILAWMIDAANTLLGKKYSHYSIDGNNLLYRYIYDFPYDMYHIECSYLETLRENNQELYNLCIKFLALIVKTHGISLWDNFIEGGPLYDMFENMLDENENGDESQNTHDDFVSNYGPESPAFQIYHEIIKLTQTITYDALTAAVNSTSCTNPKVYEIQTLLYSYKEVLTSAIPFSSLLRPGNSSYDDADNCDLRYMFIWNAGVDDYQEYCYEDITNNFNEYGLPEVTYTYTLDIDTSFVPPRINEMPLQFAEMLELFSFIISET